MLIMMHATDFSKRVNVRNCMHICMLSFGLYDGHVGACNIYILHSASH